MGNLADEELRLRLLTLAGRGQTLIVGGEKSGRLTRETADTFRVLPPLPDVCKIPPGRFDPNAASTCTQYQRIKLVVDDDKVTVYAPVEYYERQAAECLAAMWRQVKGLRDINVFMRDLCPRALAAFSTPMGLWQDLAEVFVSVPDKGLCKAWLWIHRDEYPWPAEKPEGFTEVLGT